MMRQRRQTPPSDPASALYVRDGRGPAFTRRDMLRGAASLAAVPLFAPLAASGYSPRFRPSSNSGRAFDGVQLSILQAPSFIPESDPFFQRQIQTDFMAQTGATVSIQFTNANDIPARISAALQAGAGPDVVLLQFAYSQPQALGDSLVDVTDLCTELKRSTTGDFYPQVEATCRAGDAYLAVPHDLGGNLVHWRRSWFAEIGVSQLPTTYAEFHAAGRLLKARGHPFGQALGHTINDPVAWCYPLLWAYGGREVDEQGNVAINSPETVAALAEMQAAWKSAYDEGGLAWDETSNNRAFLAGALAASNNGPSIWFVAQHNLSWFFDDIGLDFLPAGPAGAFTFASTSSYAIMRYSPNIEAARAFVRWTMQPSVWLPWCEVNRGYSSGVGSQQDANASWEKLPPVLRVLQGLGPRTRAPGWPGPYDQRAGLAQSKHILVDMFARAVQGDTPEAAATWAENELNRIYTPRLGATTGSRSSWGGPTPRQAQPVPLSQTTPGNNPPPRSARAEVVQ
jgi:multiple sugar transport system substrate-binding protein